MKSLGLLPSEMLRKLSARAVGSKTQMTLIKILRNITTGERRPGRGRERERRSKSSTDVRTDLIVSF